VGEPAGGGGADEVAVGLGDAGEDDAVGVGDDAGLVLADGVADGVADGEPDGVAPWLGAELPWTGPTMFGVCTC
jgi:hypothetical protein